MKTPLVAIVALACAGLAPLYGEKTGEAEGLKTRPSHADLSQRLAQNSELLGSQRITQPVDVAELIPKSKKNLGGLIERSTILAYGGYWTFVPKGAVLYAPPAFKDRLSPKPAGELLSWQNFFARNRGWIHTQPVTIENARGEVPLPDTVSETHKKLGRIVIAALHNGPISVKPPVEKTIAPAADKAAAQINPR